MARERHLEPKAPDLPCAGWLRFGFEVVRDPVFVAVGPMACFPFIALFPTLITAGSQGAA